MLCLVKKSIPLCCWVVDGIFRSVFNVGLDILGFNDGLNVGSNVGAEDGSFVFSVGLMVVCVGGDEIRSEVNTVNDEHLLPVQLKLCAFIASTIATQFAFDGHDIEHTPVPQ